MAQPAKSGKYHVNILTNRAGICRATKKGCPLRTEEGEIPPHFETKEEARGYIANEAKQKYDPITTLKKKKGVITARDVTDKPLGEYRNAETVKAMKEEVNKNALKLAQDRLKAGERKYSDATPYVGLNDQELDSRIENVTKQKEQLARDLDISNAEMREALEETKKPIYNDPSNRDAINQKYLNKFNENTKLINEYNQKLSEENQLRMERTQRTESTPYGHFTDKELDTNLTIAQSTIDTNQKRQDDLERDIADLERDINDPNIIQNSKKSLEDEYNRKTKMLEAVSEEKAKAVKTKLKIQRQKNLRATRKSQGNIDVAINNAKTRGNVHLQEKLAKSDVVVISNNLYTDNKEEPYGVSDMLKNARTLRQVEDARTTISDRMSSIANSSSIATGTKFTVKNDAGTFTATVKDGGFNEKAFEDLPPSLKKNIMKDEPHISIDKVRRHLDKKTQAALINKGLVTEYVGSGGSEKIDVPKAFDNPNMQPEQKMQKELESLSTVYAQARHNSGNTVSVMKAEKTAMAEGAKEYATMINHEEKNIFMTESNNNEGEGVLISGRETISRSYAEKILDPRQLAVITEMRKVPDKDKARAALSPESYNKIFNNRTVTLRATEKKD